MYIFQFSHVGVPRDMNNNLRRFSTEKNLRNTDMRCAISEKLILRETVY